MKSRAGLLLFVITLAVGCAAPRPREMTVSTPPPSEEAVIEQIRAAAKVRDLDALTRLRPSARVHAKARAELSRAVYWVGGVAEARDDLDSVCREKSFAQDSKERSMACATLMFTQLAQGKPLNHLRTGGEGHFLNKQKLFIAMVSVNGNQAEPFIVDTGAPTTVISRRYADRVKLPYLPDLGERASDAAGNAVQLHPVLLGSLKWGEIEIENVPAHVLELPENFKVGGILSPQDALRGIAFEIDGSARALRVFSEPRASNWDGSSERPHWEAPLLWSGGNLFVEARATDLTKLPFLLDSGAGGNGVCEEALRAAGKSLDGGQGGTTATAAGHAQVRTGIDGTLSVADESPRPTSFFVQSCPRDKSGPVDKSGYVGAPWFWARRVYFPIDRRRIIFTEATAP